MSGHNPAEKYLPIEIINLSDPSDSCKILPIYPYSSHGLFTDFDENGKLLICGGIGNNSDACYFYRHEDNKFDFAYKMNLPRIFSGSFKSAEGLYALGGYPLGIERD